MKCPCCGHEMVMDGHRKIDLNMCYNCGYIEGRRIEPTAKQRSNYEHLLKLNLNETAAFLAEGLGLSEEQISSWMEQVSA